MTDKNAKLAFIKICGQSNAINNRFNVIKISSLNNDKDIKNLGYSFDASFLSVNERRDIFYKKEILLSQSFSYEIIAYSKNDLELSFFINKKIELSLSYDNKFKKIFGLITEVKTSNNSCLDGGLEYKFILNSILYPLKNSYNYKVIVKKTIPEIIELTLLYNNLVKNIHYKLDLSSVYPELDCWIQYQESDYENLYRLISKWGVFYYFDDDVIIFSDKNYKKNDANIKFTLGSKSKENNVLDSFKFLLNYTTDNLFYTDYDSNNPFQPLLVSSSNTTKIQSIGRFNVHGVNFTNKKIGEKIISIHQQSIDWQRQIFTIKTNNVSVAVGDIIELEDNFYNKFSGKYLVVGVCETLNVTSAYFGKQEDIQQEGYFNKLYLIPLLNQFRLPLKYKQTSYPPITAEIYTFSEDDNSNKCQPLSSLDSSGCYRIIYDFDKINNELDINSRTPVAKSISAFVGNKYNVGMHFPNYTNNKVVVNFINGDINRPIIIGCLHNDTMPVTKKNNLQNVIATRTAKINFDDNNLQPHLSISNNWLNKICLKTKVNDCKQSSIHIKSKIGCIDYYSGNDVNFNARYDYTTNIEKNYYENINLNYNISADESIAFCAKQDINASIECDSNFSTNKNSINLISNNNFIINTNSYKLVSIDNTNINASSSSIDVYSNNNFNIKSANKITISQSGASISISEQEISIHSSNKIRFLSTEQVQVDGVVHIN